MEDNIVLNCICEKLEKSNEYKYLIYVPKLASGFLSKIPYNNIQINEKFYLDFLDMLDDRNKQDMKFRLSNNPSSIVFVSTDDCKGKCAYCYAKNINNKVNKHLTVDILKSFNIDWKTLKTIAWFGGEPIIHLADVENIMDYIYNINKDIKHSIITSLFYDDDLFYKFKEFIKKDYINHIQITLDPIKYDDKNNSFIYKRVYQNLKGLDLYNFLLNRIKELNSNKVVIHGVYHSAFSINDMKKYFNDLKSIGIDETRINFNVDTTNDNKDIQKSLLEFYNSYCTNVYSIGNSINLLNFDFPFYRAFYNCGNLGTIAYTYDGYMTDCTDCSTKVKDLSVYNKTKQLGFKWRNCYTCEWNNMCDGMCHSFYSENQCYLRQISFIYFLKILAKRYDEDYIYNFLKRNNTLDIKLFE